MAAGTGRFWKYSLAAIIVLQRIAIPFGGSQVALLAPLALVALAVGLRNGELKLDPIRTKLYVVALIMVLVDTGLAEGRGLNPSLLSVGFLLVLYAPATAIGRDNFDRVRILRTFVNFMTLLGTIGLGLFALQYVGLKHQDWLAKIVPSDFLLRGYNTNATLSYESTYFRSNAAIFLEPSFFSLFLGTAIVIGLQQSASRLRIGIMAAALITTVALSGFVVIAIGVLFILASDERRLLRSLVLPAALAATILALTSLGHLTAGRGNELSTSNSSGSLRLLQPYPFLFRGWDSSTTRILFGSGAGSAERYFTAHNAPVGLLAPLVPKLVFEYGIFTALIFLVFLCYIFTARARITAWTGGLLVLYVFVNASLLQADLALTTILFLSWLPAPRYNWALTIDGELAQTSLAKSERNDLTSSGSS